MNAMICAVCASLSGQAPAPSPHAPAPSAALFPDVGAPASGTYEPPPPPTVTPFSAASGSFDDLGVRPAQYAQPVAAPPVAVGMAPPAAPVAGAPNYAQAFEERTGLFQSDHAFDGFTGPLSNPVQFKDPRSLTESRVPVHGRLRRAEHARPRTAERSRSTPSAPRRADGTLADLRRQGRDRPALPESGQVGDGPRQITAGLKYVWIRERREAVPLLDGGPV